MRTGSGRGAKKSADSNEITGDGNPFCVFPDRCARHADSAHEAAGTAELFTGISRDVDQQLWFLEAHLQAGTAK